MRAKHSRDNEISNATTQLEIENTGTTPAVVAVRFSTEDD